MERIKTAYRNMPIKRALIITTAVSLSISFLLSLFILMITRPSYYQLTAINQEGVTVFLHDLITFLMVGISIAASMIAGIYFFYKYKIALPLQTLMDGTEQISHENLEFTMSYDAEDELGVLCKSFDRMREELYHNYRQMWRTTEERKKINAAFAHDLRTPLTVLQGYTDFLEEYIAYPEKSDEKLQSTNRMMAQYIKRLENYVETMNTIQKLEDTPIHIQCVAIADFMEMLTDNVKLTAKEYGKQFYVTDETGLMKIQGDVPLIFRTLENITRNAFQYAKSKVFIRLFYQESKLYIEVIDDGAGFSKNDLSQALNPFYTSAREDTSHFGIGLNICKILCENHGGGITLCNTKDLGAKVEISFLIKKTI